MRPASLGVTLLFVLHASAAVISRTSPPTALPTPSVDAPSPHDLTKRQRNNALENVVVAFGIPVSLAAVYALVKWSKKRPTKNRKKTKRPFNVRF